MKIKLTESKLRKIVIESVRRVLKENRKYLNDAIYIVCDGSSYYGVYGCEVEEEIEVNDVEVVKGPFAEWDDKVETLIEKLNDELNGTSLYR